MQLHEIQVPPRAGTRVLAIAFSSVLGFLLLLFGTLSLAGEGDVTAAVTVIGLVALLFAAITATYLRTRLTVVANASGMHIRFAPYFGSGRFIAWTDVARATIRRVRPFGEFGGWGVRWTVGSKTGYLWQGETGVDLHLHNGRHVVVTVVDIASLRAILGRTSIALDDRLSTS